MSINKELVMNPCVRNAAIDEWVNSGKTVVGTICCHVPEELLHAAGLLPVRVRATGCTNDSTGETWMSSFACGYCRAALEYMLDGTYDFLGGLVASNGCHMASRIYDNVKYSGTKDTSKFFLKDIEAPRVNNAITLKYYREELEDLKVAIEKFYNVEITDEKLKASIALYNETRALIRELYELRKADHPTVTGEECLKITLAAMSTPKEQFNEFLKGYLEEIKNRAPVENVRARVLFIGSSMDDPNFLKTIEDKGGLVVSDIQCFGSRYMFDEVAVEGTAMDSLAKAYLNKVVCPRMTGIHEDLAELIISMAKEYKVDGIVFARMKNCDLWGGEMASIGGKIAATGLPVLTLEREEIMTNIGQLAIRAEAFVEMIEE